MIDKFRPRESFYYNLGNDKLAVHVEDSKKQLAWQLEVNGSKSEPTSYYQGILEHKGYFLATAYWEGRLPKLVPFKIVTAAIGGGQNGDSKR